MTDDILAHDPDGLTRDGRTILPDLIRAWAIIGIVVVNVAAFAYPMEAGYHFGGYLTPVDHYADGAVYALFMSKS
ncbi:MAG: hypothetical protein V3V30_03955, partial [Parvularculaceae bacterium]